MQAQMFAVARQQRILVLDFKVYKEITVKERPDFRTRAWIVCKTDQWWDMSREDFFYNKVMDF